MPKWQTPKRQTTPCGLRTFLNVTIGTRAGVLHEREMIGRIGVGVGGFPHDEEVANLSEEACCGAGTVDLLGVVGTVHGATDPAFGEEASLDGRDVAKKGVIKITEAWG